MRTRQLVYRPLTAPTTGSAEVASMPGLPSRRLIPSVAADTGSLLPAPLSTSVLHSRTTAPAHSRTCAQRYSCTAARQHRKGQAYNVQKRGMEGGAEGSAPALGGSRTTDTDLDVRGGDVGRPPCPVRRADLQDQAAHLGAPPWRSGYRPLIGTGGDMPICAPDDRGTAFRLLQEIDAAIGRGGWSSNERGRLARLRRIWLARSRGEDARYMIAGNRPGRLRTDELRRVHVLQRRLAVDPGYATTAMDGGADQPAWEGRTHA